MSPTDSLTRRLPRNQTVILLGSQTDQQLGLQHQDDFSTILSQTVRGYFLSVQNYLNVDVVFMSASIPKGKVVMTVDNNMNFYYVDMRGEAGRTFGMKVDETGLIGVTHKQTQESLSYDTIAAGGWLLIPERTDGIVTSTISQPTTSLPKG